MKYGCYQGVVAAAVVVVAVAVVVAAVVAVAVGSRLHASHININKAA